MPNYTRSPIGELSRVLDPTTGALARVEDRNGNDYTGMSLTAAQAAAVRFIFDGIPSDSSSAAAAANDTRLAEIVAANTTTAIEIEFAQPYSFSASVIARSSVILVGRGKAAAITFIPTTSNDTWFTWSRNSAHASQLNEELQLIGCGIRNLYIKSDRSVRANFFWMNGVDFPFVEYESFGCKGTAMRMSNTRCGAGTRIIDYYSGYTDLANGLNNKPAFHIDSSTAAWDGSNLLSFADVQIYYPFGPGIKLEGAYSNILGGSSFTVHQLARADTSFEANFILAFPTFNGAAAAVGCSAGAVALNEYMAHHVGFASAPSVANRLWQAHHAIYNHGMWLTCDASDNVSSRNRIGQGRFIGGGTLYTVLLEGGSDAQFISSEITSASAYAADVTCNAATDVWTYSAALAAGAFTQVPPTGTPFFMPTAITPPAGTAAALTYYMIRESTTTFKAARTYADCFAAAFTGSINASGVLSVTAFSSGELKVGMLIATGATAGTRIMNRLTGSRVGVGTWQTNTPGVIASTAMTVATVPIDITDAGIGVQVYAGGMPLCALDDSRVVIDSRSYIDNGSVAAWHDDTSSIVGNARTGPLWTYLPISRQESPETVLFMARNIPLSALGDVAQMAKMFGGRRYYSTRLVAIQKSAATAATGIIRLWTAAAGTGTAVTAATTLSSLGSANTIQTITPTVTTPTVFGSDPVLNVNVGLYVNCSTAVAGGVIDLIWYGYPVD